MHRILLLFVLLLGTTMLVPRSAHAGRGVVIVNSGSDAFETGPLPPVLAEVPELAGYKGAYTCKIWGIFWVYFTINDCRLVAYNPSTQMVVDDPRVTAELAKVYSEKDMHVGFWKGTMRWILLGLLGVMVLGMVYSRITSGPASANVQPEAWHQDPRVQYLLTEFGKAERWSFTPSNEPDVWRVVNMKAFNGTAYVDINDPTVQHVMLLLTRSNAPKYLQISVDVQTRALSRVELGYLQYQAMS